MAKLRVPDKVWNKFQTILEDFHDADVGKQPILWKRWINIPSMYGEDDTNNFEDVQIEALIGYNYYRTWPINRNTSTGELDTQNQVVWVSKRYLEENGWLSENGYWDFDRVMDRFVLDGIVYKASGDTTMTQAKDNSVLFFLILKREEITNQDDNFG